MQLFIAWFNLGRSRCVFGHVIVLGTDFDDALLALRKAFTRFREHCLKLKPMKCNFFKEEVEFLRKLVSRRGVSISTDKLEAAKQWPVPTNVKELKSFLGFMNYPRNHSKNVYRSQLTYMP